jgi:RNA polymerase sigma factor (sigma-70 family)
LVLPDLLVYGTDERSLRMEALFTAHARSVWAYARRRTDPATADDVVDEVFVVAWRQLDTVPDDVLPWLLACARHALANAQRAERRRTRLFDRVAAEASLRENASEPLDDGLLGAALSTLSVRDRETLLLVAWEGLSSAQAAVVLGCSPQAFRVRSHRARRRLEAALRRADGTVRSGRRRCRGGPTPWIAAMAGRVRSR